MSLEDSHASVVVVVDEFQDAVGGVGGDAIDTGSIVQDGVDDDGFLGSGIGDDPLPGVSGGLEDGVDVRLFGTRDDFWRLHVPGREIELQRRGAGAEPGQEQNSAKLVQ